jgi:ABC-type cobalamin transport system ATPase subunit
LFNTDWPHARGWHNCLELERDQILKYGKSCAVLRNPNLQLVFEIGKFRQHNLIMWLQEHNNVN